MIELRDGLLAATVHPALAMLVSSLRHDGEELLGQRKGVEAYAATGATMGIPFLHPWANRVERVSGCADDPGLRRDGHGLAIHGLRTAGDWELVAADDRSVTGRLAFAAHPAFPSGHSVDVTTTLAGDALTIATTIRADRGDTVPVAFGWHPYLVIAGVARADWVLEAPALARMTLDDRLLPTGERAPSAGFAGPLGATTFDDLYDGAGPGVRFAIAGSDKRIAVTFGDGYPFAQIYAPAAEDLVSFEPMTAPGNALVSGDGLRWVEPGGAFTATFTISVG